MICGKGNPMIATRALAISLIGLLLTACKDISPKSVTLHNRSAESLSDVSVDFAGDAKRVARLSPGQFVGLASAKGREGVICVTFTREGVTRSYGFEYMTAHMPSNCRMEVGDHSVEVACNGDQRRSLEPIVANGCGTASQKARH